jgi:hypothetical protein
MRPFTDTLAIVDHIIRGRGGQELTDVVKQRSHDCSFIRA